MKTNLKEYTLKNKFLTVDFLNYGGTIKSIVMNEVDDKRNLVSSYDNLDDLLVDRDFYINALIAPVAGRIAYATYNDGDKDVHLSKDRNNNHLHGGKSGLSFQLLNVEMKSDTEAVLSLVVDHSEDGFVGTFDYKIIYKLIDNEFIIEYLCTPSEKTILNMTSHLYFNLNGSPQQPVHNHDLYIRSSKRMTIHPDNYPGNVIEIDRAAYDFNTMKNLGDVLNSDDEHIVKARGLDTPYDIEDDVILQVEDIKLTIKTDAECGVFYTANYFTEDMVLNNGNRGRQHASIAIETQDIPNAINVLKDDKYLFSPDRAYKQKTHYIFNMRKA